MTERDRENLREGQRTRRASRPRSANVALALALCACGEASTSADQGSDAIGRSRADEPAIDDTSDAELGASDTTANQDDDTTANQDDDTTANQDDDTTANQDDDTTTNQGDTSANQGDTSASQGDDMTASEADQSVVAEGDPDATAGSRATLLLLDDAEDGDNVTLPQASGLLGHWYSFDDRLECDNATPDAGETEPLPEPRGGPPFTMTAYAAVGAEPPDATPDNRYGVRLSGGGHALWGAGLGVTFDDQADFPEPLDLTQLGATALRFWGRSARGTLDVSVRLADVHSEPAYALCIPRDNSTCEPSQGCFDAPVHYIQLSDEWQLYELSLSAFAREGWGYYARDVTPPLGLDATRVVQLQFWLPVVDAFDVWLDDVGFVLDGE